jgi:hypothetical protein
MLEANNKLREYCDCSLPVAPKTIFWDCEIEIEIIVEVAALLACAVIRIHQFMMKTN